MVGPYAKPICATVYQRFGFKSCDLFEIADHFTYEYIIHTLGSTDLKMYAPI